MFAMKVMTAAKQGIIASTSFIIQLELTSD